MSCILEGAGQRFATLIGIGQQRNNVPLSPIVETENLTHFY